MNTRNNNLQVSNIFNSTEECLNWKGQIVYKNMFKFGNWYNLKYCVWRCELLSVKYKNLKKVVKRDTVFLSYLFILLYIILLLFHFKFFVYFIISTIFTELYLTITRLLYGKRYALWFSSQTILRNCTLRYKLCSFIF